MVRLGIGEIMENELEKYIEKKEKEIVEKIEKEADSLKKNEEIEIEEF